MTDPFPSPGAKIPPKPFTKTEGRREIRSFVLRQGRFTEAQQRAFDELWPQLGIDYRGEPRDYAAIFGRAAPLVLEIGTGNGEALRHAARHDPARNYLGIEVHAPGVGRLLNGLAEDGSRHARVYHHDAVEVLNHEVADGSLDEVRIYFPDPWHKKRHHKRRLVQPEFARLIVRKLAGDGRLHLATDWQAYAEQLKKVSDLISDPDEICNFQSFVFHIVTITQDAKQYRHSYRMSAWEFNRMRENINREDVFRVLSYVYN